MSDPHWIEKATAKNKGAFGKQAAAAGKSTAAFAAKNAAKPGTLGKRARLAKVLLGLRKRT